MTSLPHGSKARILRALRVYLNDLHMRKHEAERKVFWVPPSRRRTAKGKKTYESSKKHARRASDITHESNKAFELMKAIRKMKVIDNG